jgi:exodeoxyribonuclease V alpha subunit
VHVVASERAAIAGSRTVAERPLVLDGTRLSTQREHAAEQRLIAALVRRASASDRARPRRTDTADRRPRPGRRRGCAGDAGVRAGIGVLAGGPGTGKTTTVAALLAARVEADLGRGAAARTCPRDRFASRSPLRRGRLRRV